MTAAVDSAPKTTWVGVSQVHHQFLVVGGPYLQTANAGMNGTFARSIDRADPDVNLGTDG